MEDVPDVQTGNLPKMEDVPEVQTGNLPYIYTEDVPAEGGRTHMAHTTTSGKYIHKHRLYKLYKRSIHVHIQGPYWFLYLYIQGTYLFLYTTTLLKQILTYTHTKTNTTINKTNVFILLYPKMFLDGKQSDQFTAADDENIRYVAYLSANGTEYICKYSKLIYRHTRQHTSDQVKVNTNVT